MNVLFVCKHNRFRSKVAEAIFARLNSRIKVKSAGIRLDLMRPYVAKIVLDVLKKKGYFVAHESSREINDKDIKWADRIIIVADNVGAGTFPPEKIEIWSIGDADEEDKKKIEKITKEIEQRVKELVKRL